MKPMIQLCLTIYILTLLVVCPLQAQNKQHLTTTLLPIIEEVRDADNNRQNAPNSHLWIQQKPQVAIFLQFDLHGLPDALNCAHFRECSLRLVASNLQYQPKDNTENTGGGTVAITGRSAADDLSSWDANKFIVLFRKPPGTNDPNVRVGSSSTLSDELYKQYVGDKIFTVRLESGSDKAGALFFSNANSGSPPNPSNVPRLVIEYTAPESTLLETMSWPQHQHDPEHTGRSSWRPFRGPNGFSLTEIGIPEGSISDYPLIYRGNIYLVNKIEKTNSLVALDFKGRGLWRKDIGKKTVQCPPAISREGILYVVTESQIADYDLSWGGTKYEPYSLSGKPSAYTDLTVGNDGSVFLVLKENGNNYIYGLTYDLKPFLKSDPLGKGIDKISSVTVSADGKKIFAQIPEGAVIIDIVDPSQQQTLELKNDANQTLEYYHTPVAGPSDGVMVFSDFTKSANKGNVWGYNTNRIWSAHGTLIPQPVLGSNDFVYYIQGGALQGKKYDTHGSEPNITSSDSDLNLNTTSNLVMDGNDNIYFWDNGLLYGYSSQGQRLFQVDFTSGGLKKRPMEPEVIVVSIDEGGEGYTTPPTVGFVGGGGSGAEATAIVEDVKQDGRAPEQFIRLMLGPDGTLWANNKNGNALFAFQPLYADKDLTLRQADIKTQTVYRAAGKIAIAKAVEDNVTIEAGVNILLQAQNGISFPKGFAVQKGAGLLCRTGY